MRTNQSRTAQSDSTWIQVPAGQVLLGGDYPGEGPPGVVNVPSFLISVYAVSNDEYTAFMQDAGYHRPEFWAAEGLIWLRSQKVLEPAFWRDSLFNQPNQPVTGVSFYEAQAFAQWQNARLPSEAEWEKAARGPRGFLYPWGDEQPNALRANFAPGYVPVNRSPIAIHECELGDSPYGCRQMAGNVYEWCQDFFHVDTPDLRTEANLLEVRPSHRRVMRGGSWGSGASRLRGSARWSSPPELRDNVVGFRLIR
jgi:iron(II)-dependent oxidoreductase